MEYERKTTEYDCEENENTIRIVTEDSYLDEIEVGCRFAEYSGWSVIGAKDLCNALRKVGYEVRRVE